MFLTLSSIISFKSFRTEGAEWRRFARVMIFVVSTPVILSCLLAEFAAWKMGDTIPFAEVALAQARNPKLLYMPTRDVDVARYKLVRVVQERPDILLMGESRGMYFRDGMFQPYSFYNLSVPAAPLAVQVDLLNALPKNYEPRVIFLITDFFVLNSTYAADLSFVAPHFESRPWTDYLTTLHDGYINWLTHPEAMFHRLHDPLYGLPSIGSRPTFTSYGMRADGSYTLYPNQFETAGGDPPTMAKIMKNPICRFFRNDRIDESQLAVFEQLVKLAQSRGIRLICFQPPIYGPALRGVEQVSRSRMLEDFEARAAHGYFDQLGVSFFDFIRYPPWSENYAYFMDPFHPLEVLDGKMILKMSEDPRVRTLLPRLDTSDLARRLDENARANRHLYLYSN